MSIDLHPAAKLEIAQVLGVQLLPGQGATPASIFDDVETLAGIIERPMLEMNLMQSLVPQFPMRTPAPQT
jgi:hypothetical protein